jgi:hypothetical protein
MAVGCDEPTVLRRSEGAFLAFAAQAFGSAGRSRASPRVGTLSTSARSTRLTIDFKAKISALRAFRPAAVIEIDVEGFRPSKDFVTFINFASSSTRRCRPRFPGVSPRAFCR